MQFLGLDASYVVGGLLIGIALLTLTALALVVGAVLLGAASVLVFRRTRKVFIPRLTLFLLSLLEAPIKYSLWFFRIDEGVIDQMLVQIRNMLYSEAYAKTPFSKRAVFLPQCLRSPNCPAKLTPEGIKCVECGQCGISEVKKIAESLGYMFFIVPGSSFIKRMVKKYRPEALLGIGCSMEVKQGSAMVASIGLPVQGVMLLKDGCVSTRVNVKDLLAKIHMNNGATKEVSNGEVERVSNAWVEHEPKVFVKLKKEIN
jgi:hypothetical protein